MTKRFIYLLMAALSVAAIFAACDKGEEEETVDPADLKELKFSISTVNDWIFDGEVKFAINVENPNKVEVDVPVNIYLKTDTKKSLEPYTKEVKVPAGKSDIDISFTLEPGFYKATCMVSNKTVRAFVFGVSPALISSPPDKQPDFDTYWDAAVTQLEGIQMNATLTELTTVSSEARKAYLVEMQSVPDGLSGDPVVIRGYYLEPTDGQKHPVIMHFQPYDNYPPTYAISCPSAGKSQEFAEFTLSHRGQYINNRPASMRSPDDGKGDLVNAYGDWFAFQFGQKDGYYYRGAFLDCVQAIRFMATRPTSDMNNVFAEGASQGGALSYAAAALSPYPLRAIAPCVAFLGDFPDYFQIVTWPGNTAKAEAKKASMTDDEMYAFLSYFDTKNLATRIHCAVLACSGLMDETCPPHTNTAPFNNVQVTDKKMRYYPNMKHEQPKDWGNQYMTFFRERIAK